MSQTVFHSELVWRALGGAVLVTFVFRAAGAFFSGRIHAESEFFKWLTAVTYALMAALTLRLLMLPSGLLETIPWWLRLLIGVAAFTVMLGNPARRLLHAVGTGCLLTLAFGLWRTGWQ